MMESTGKHAKANLQPTKGAAGGAANLPVANDQALPVPIAGVAIDKIIALDRGPRLPDLHEHLHITKEQAMEAARELLASRNSA